MIFFGKFTVLGNHDSRLRMASNVLACLKTIRCVNSNRNASCEDRPVEAYQPFRCIEADDADCGKFRDVVSY
jgi:hypothetical protein